MTVRLKTYKRKPSPSLHQSQFKDQSTVLSNYLANELQELENVLGIQEQADGEKTQALSDGARITTGTINAARISLSGHNTSELNNNSGFATGTEVATAVGAIDLSGYVANGDLAGYVTTVQGAALQSAAEGYADGITENFQTAAQVSSAILNDETIIDGARITTGTIAAARISISGLDASTLNNDAFAVPADIPDVSGLAASADVTAAQAAAQLYADGLVTGFQTAAQVSAAIESDTTVIDGARITTGTIAAARISLSGFNLSDLNNDGFALSTDIPNISNLQTAAQVTAAIQTDTTTINGSRIVTGSLSAGTISGGTLDFTNVEADNLYVSSIRGDVNTLIPFKKQTTQTIPYLTAGTSFTIFEGTIPASGSADILRKPYFSATGWGVFENADVYKLELYMRVNDPTPSSTNTGVISDPLIFSANSWFGVSASIKVPGQVSLPTGTVLQDSVSSSGSNPRTLGSVWYVVYTASTNTTTILYFADSNGVGPILSTAGRYAITPPPASGYALVNEFFFRSPFDYDPYQFALNGALNDATQYSVDCQVKVRLFNQVGSGLIPNSQPSKDWSLDRIYNVSGILMALR